MMSSELDILIVARNPERFALEIRTAFRHWQVYNCDAPQSLWGRKFRRAYYTRHVLEHPAGPGILHALRDRGQIIPFREYKAEVDLQSFEDEALLRAIRRSRYAQ